MKDLLTMLNMSDIILKNDFVKMFPLVEAMFRESGYKIDNKQDLIRFCKQAIFDLGETHHYVRDGKKHYMAFVENHNGIYIAYSNVDGYQFYSGGVSMEFLFVDGVKSHLYMLHIDGKSINCIPLQSIAVMYRLDEDQQKALSEHRYVRKGRKALQLLTR